MITATIRNYPSAAHQYLSAKNGENPHGNPVWQRRRAIITSDASGKMARLTGLEPATSGVTGRHSNQLSYNRAIARSPGRGGLDTRG